MSPGPGDGLLMGRAYSTFVPLLATYAASTDTTCRKDFCRVRFHSWKYGVRILVSTWNANGPCKEGAPAVKDLKKLVRSKLGAGVVLKTERSSARKGGLAIS